MTFVRFPLFIVFFFILVLPITQAADIQKVNINTANALSLSHILSGIGPKRAAAIIKYRTKHGAFKSLKDLEKVHGIGPKTIQRNKAKIILGRSAPVKSKTATPKIPVTSKTPKRPVKLK